MSDEKKPVVPDQFLSAVGGHGRSGKGRGGERSSDPAHIDNITGEGRARISKNHFDRQAEVALKQAHKKGLPIFRTTIELPEGIHPDLKYVLALKRQTGKSYFLSLVIQDMVRLIKKGYLLPNKQLVLDLKKELDSLVDMDDEKEK